MPRPSHRELDVRTLSVCQSVVNSPNGLFAETGWVEQRKEPIGAAIGIGFGYFWHNVSAAVASNAHFLAFSTRTALVAGWTQEQHIQ